MGMSIHFEKLTHPTLLSLRRKGFNVLRSVSPLTSENPTWIPDRVAIESFWNYDSESLIHLIPEREIHYLLIDDAIKKIKNEELIGEVLID